MQNDQINELDDKNVNKESYLKMYICILDEFPDYMTPTLVAHATLGAHIEFSKIKTDSNLYEDWLTNSYKKVVVRVNQGLYDKIKLIENEFTKDYPIIERGESTTLNGKKSCLILLARHSEIPKPLKKARLWKPKT